MRINRYIFYAFILLFFVSCQDRNCIERKVVDGEIIESCFINDSTYHGITKFYSLTNNILEAEIEFNNGIKNGYEKKYYANSKLQDSINFLHGVANGEHFIYDTLGRVEYKDFFFRGLAVGGVHYYDKGTISIYDFLNFDKKLLFKAEYDSIGSVEKFGGDIINFDVSSKIIADSLAQVLFLYLISPPNVNVEYSIGIYDSTYSKSNIFKTILQTKVAFVEIILPIVGEKKSYYVQAKYIDSLNDFKQIHVKYF